MAQLHWHNPDTNAERSAKRTRNRLWLLLVNIAVVAVAFVVGPVAGTAAIAATVFLWAVEFSDPTESELDEASLRNFVEVRDDGLYLHVTFDPEEWGSSLLIEWACLRVVKVRREGGRVSAIAIRDDTPPRMIGSIELAYLEDMDGLLRSIRERLAQDA